MSQESKNSALTEAQKETLRLTIVSEARKLLGIPYRLGAEWTDYTDAPKEMDCSELVEGVYKITGLDMKDGSQNQFDFTLPAAVPKFGDLAFFGRGCKPTQVYHVGILFDENNIIEARAFHPGSSFETGKVILRPRAKWENYKDFLGYRCLPKLA